MRSRLLADAWPLAAPFWRDRAERGAWLQLAIVVGLTLASVALNVAFSNWNNAFYDTLQNRDLSAFGRELAQFGLLAAGAIVAAVYRQYVQQRLQMRWRAWLTNELAQAWLEPGVAYRIDAAAASGRPDNPDQRIAEDANGFVATTLSLALGLLNASVTLVSFVGILWRLSGTLQLGDTIALPGYMVWVALVYSLAGSLGAHWVGRRLVGLNAQQQRVEADFRYALVQVRDHAEAIALASGEARECARLQQVFAAVRANWQRLIAATKRLTWFSVGYGQIAVVFPLVAAAPRYFSGAIQLGALMQTAQAFGQVQGALSWFVDAYGQLAGWRATVQRLAGFRAAIEHDAAPPSAPRIARGPAHGFADGLAHGLADGSRLAWSALELHVPGGTVRLHAPAGAIERGERVAIAGASGSGKSSWLRAVAGLWRDGRGRIALPAAATLMVVPQRPFIPDGSLREALTYPLPGSAFAEERVRQVLGLCGLAEHLPLLDIDARWGRSLSPGEQQRLQFARVMLHQPDWVLLDEATSALDELAERALYDTLAEQCPQTTIASVAHRASALRWHARRWSIDDDAAAAKVPGQASVTT